MAKMLSKEEAGLRRFHEDGTIDLVAFEELRSAGYLNRDEHPDFPLWLWNYSEKCQFENYWTPETVSARGLITDHNGVIIARPFQKFWNFEEHHGKLPQGPYEVWEKVDGSLGILYWWNSRAWIATRGSFVSDQAKTATHFLHSSDYREYFDKLDKDFTYLFEIIYPENRIVVNYADKKALVLLGAIHTAQGWEISPSTDMWPDVAEFFSILGVDDNPLHLKFLTQPNKEGFVIRYTGSGLRLKVKFDEYLEIHRVVFGLTPKLIWEMLQSNDEERLWTLISKAPDEYHDWAREIVKDLQTRYNECVDVATGLLREALNKYQEKKDIAQFLLTYGKDGHLALAFLNGKDYSKMIWRGLRPKATKPFEQIEFVGDNED